MLLRTIFLMIRKNQKGGRPSGLGGARDDEDMIIVPTELGSLPANLPLAALRHSRKNNHPKTDSGIPEF